MAVSFRRVENGLPPTVGAEDGIRTREPHLGKVRVFVRLGLAGPLKCGSVHPVSSPSMTSAPVVERSTRAPLARGGFSVLYGIGGGSLGGARVPQMARAAR